MKNNNNNNNGTYFNIDYVHDYRPAFFKFLKVDYFLDFEDSPSYDEIANIDDYVTDEEVIDYYKNTEFSEDDFMICEETKEKMKMFDRNHKYTIDDVLNIEPRYFEKLRFEVAYVNGIEDVSDVTDEEVFETFSDETFTADDFERFSEAYKKRHPLYKKNYDFIDFPSEEAIAEAKAPKKAKWCDATEEEKFYVIEKAALRIMSEIWSDFSTDYDECFSAEELRRMLTIAVSCEANECKSREMVSEDEAYELILDVFGD